MLCISRFLQTITCLQHTHNPDTPDHSQDTREHVSTLISDWAVREL